MGQRMKLPAWLRRTDERPLVELLELGLDGAMIAWCDEASRDVVLRMVGQIALRVAGASDGERLALHPTWSSVGPISAVSIEEFSRRAPAILNDELRYCESELRVGERALFRIAHLDQSLAGVSFSLLDPGQPIDDLISTALLEARDRNPEIAFRLDPFIRT